MVNKNKKAMNNLSEDGKKEFLFNLAMDRLLGSLIIDIIPGTDIFKITVRDVDPHRAIEIANVISRSYTIVDQQQQLAELRQKFGEFHPTVMQLEENINETTQKLSGKRLPDVEAIGTASVKIIEQGRSDYQPVGKPKRMIFVIIVGLSIGLGLALAFGLDYVDQTFKSIQDIITFLNIPVIGSIPRKKFFSKQRLFNDDQPDTLYTQFSEDFADQFYVFIKTQNLHTVLITSVQRGEGSTNIIANLAVRLSQQMSCKTLLIDANFNNPSLHKLFNIKEGPGLANILEHYPVDIKSAQSNIINTDDKLQNNPEILFEKNIHKVLPNLDILPAGVFSDNPASLINESIIKYIFTYAKKNYEMVLIDSACINKNKYVEKLSLLVDGITLVVCERKIKRRTSQIVIGSLRKNNANFVGAVLNKRTFPIPKVIYNKL
jgi:Mrp family chromosome partitioning ATPase